jgi:uncharacterized protein
MFGMLEITKAEMDSLIKLKENEVEKAKIRTFLDSLPKKIFSLEAAFDSAEQRFRQKEEALEQQKKRYRDCEADIQDKQEAVKKSDVKLLSIKNNKEYHAVLKEIDDLKDRISQLEDEMLTILDVIDAEEQALAEAKKEWEQEKTGFDSEKKDLQAVQAQQETELAGLDEKWKEITADIPQALMDHYLSVKQKVSGGRAIAAAKGFVCQGCYMNIPPQLYNELCRSTTLRYCPFCHRIIYYDGNNGENGA